MIEIRTHADLVKVGALYLEDVPALEWRPITPPDHDAKMLTMLDVQLRHVHSESVVIDGQWFYALARPHAHLFAVNS